MTDLSTAGTARARLLWVVKLIISLGLMVFVVSRVDLSGTIDALMAVGPRAVPMLGLAVALYFTAHIVAAQKLEPLLPEQKRWRLFRAVMIGHFFGTALPGQVAGDAAKAVTLMDGSAPKPVVAAAVILDKHTSLVSLALLVLISVFVAPDVEFGAPAIGLAAGVLAILIAIAATPVCIQNAPGPGWLKAGHAAWCGYTKDAELMVRQVLLGLVFQTLSVGVFVALDAALGLGLDFTEWAVVAGVLSLALLLPISLAGLGVREVTLIALLPVLGVPAEQALALSLLVFALQLLSAGVGAAFILTGRTSAQR